MTASKLFWALSALVLAMAACQHAHAETALMAGGWSHHLSSGEYTETHKAVMVEHGNYLAGTFTNSYGRETWALGYGGAIQRGHWRLSGHVGLMRGYERCYGAGQPGDNTKVCPMAYPALTYTRHRVQPQVGLLGEAVVFIVRMRLY